jgi:hypothetical protein
VKTTVELPDKLLRAAKATAVARGQTLQQFVSAAVAGQVRADPVIAAKKPWMKMAGALKEYSMELDKVDKVIAEEFERINPADWK